MQIETPQAVAIYRSKNCFQKFLQKLSIPASHALLLCYIGRGELPLGLRYV